METSYYKGYKKGEEGIVAPPLKLYPVSGPAIQPPWKRYGISKIRL
jgi:hypothetical protein